MRNVVVYMLAILVVTGCGGREEPGPDAGGGTDSGFDAHVEIDAGEHDGGGEIDANMPPDADPDPDGGPEDAGLPDAARVCALGQVCNDEQPCSEGAGFRCYGFGDNGFCAPFAPECGGFANLRCADGRTCIRGPGSIGFCATPEEMDCICTSAAENGFTTDGCPATYFPDGGPVDGGEPPR